MKSRRDRHAVLGAALASAVVAAGTAGMAYALTAPAPAARPVSSSSAATPSLPAAGEGTVEPVVTESAIDYDALLGEAMADVPVGERARVSVAVLDLASGDGAVYGGGTAFDTASIVKVDILAALLLQAQDAGRELTATEKSQATAMIEYSDNASASALWEVIGGAEGLDAANERFGLTGTRGGADGSWGLTQTTSADQITLLEQVFGNDSLLDSEARAYVRGLMGGIAAGQHWGVSAVADGTAWELKNGWLPRTATGLWDINSIGRVTVDGREFLVAALSDGNVSQKTGITLVEAAAQAAVSVFAGSAAG
ncbi:serine hydrolase [Streptomyces sp. NPDC093252]|uniref:serine hydrolase n=1 Tax=Streptomyces sp. NPDC093252 TaxID=3154980 RepID=UPI00343C6BE6